MAAATWAALSRTVARAVSLCRPLATAAPSAASYAHGFPTRDFTSGLRRGIATSRASRGMEEFFPTPLKEGQAPAKAGRAWAAAELRLKSFEDLHKLWFVCLKERNMLLSERLYYKQVGQAAPDAFRLRSCKKTMAMIQVVLGERRRAAETYAAEVARRAAGAPDAGAAAPIPGPRPSAASVRLVPPAPAEAKTLDARAAAAEAIKKKYSGTKVTIKKFGRKIDVPVESDAALTPTRQARRVEQKRRTFLSQQRGLRDRLEAVEAATHGEAAVAAARERALAMPAIKRRELGKRRADAGGADGAEEAAQASA